jgi:predicted membrane protein
MTNIHHEDHPSVITRNARVGLVLFFVYFAAFVGFLMLNVFAPQVMSATELPISEEKVIVLWGTNVGVVYGIGLILLAVVLSIVYMRAVRRRG